MPVIDGSADPNYKFNYIFDGNKNYFTSRITYDKLVQGTSGTINPSTLKVEAVYEKPGKVFVQAAVLRADGTWNPLKENEARIVNGDRTLGPIYNSNSTNYVLGPAARQSLLNNKGPNNLNTALRQNASVVLAKGAQISQAQANQALHISTNTGPGGKQLPPILSLPPAAGAVPGGTGNPQQTSAAGANADPYSNKSIEELVPAASEKSGKALDIVRNSGGGRGNYLKYPIRDTYAQDDDMLKIEIYEYQKSGLGADDYKKFALEGLTKRLSGQEIIKIIYLPVYNSNGISDSLTVGWGSGELNPITAQFARIAMNTIAGGADPVNSLQKGATNILETLKDFAGSPELKSLLINYFTEQAVNTTGLLSRTAGAAINNNVELLFTGVQLRDFTLTYRLTPRSKKEAEMIKDIIRAFKISMTPSLSVDGLFLRAPCVYKLSYVTSQNRGEHPYLNKFKACALKGFNVNYTPDGNYMTYADGTSMTQYEIQFSFGEIDPIYRDDYADIGNTMGY